MTKRVVLVLTLLLVTACQQGHAREPKKEELQELGPWVTKLSSALEVHVGFEHVPPGTSEADLLRQATADAPQLLARFSPYKLRARQQGKNGVLLVCTADGKRALFEDAGCTGPLEAAHWQKTPAKGCEFTVEVAKVCGGPAAP